MSSEETTKLLAHYLKIAFGDDARVDYIDLGDPDRQEDFKEIVKATRQQHLSYPLVAIDGVLKMAGNIRIGAIANEVEKALEIHSEARKVV